MMRRALIIGAAALAGVAAAAGTANAQEQRRDVVVLQAPRPPSRPERASVDGELRAARERLSEAARAYADAVQARGGADAASDGWIRIDDTDAACRVAVSENGGRRCRVIILNRENVSLEEIERIARDTDRAAEQAR